MIKLGTSTWAYEGWQGQIYHNKYAKTTFARECLGEYAQYQYQGEPLFKTVGNDSTFYRPPTANQLRRYLTQIPEDFEMCFKVSEEITIPTYAKQARYGLKAGQPNERFLDARLFTGLVLTPTVKPSLSPTAARSSSSSSGTGCRLKSSARGSMDSSASFRKTFATP